MNQHRECCFHLVANPVVMTFNQKIRQIYIHAVLFSLQMSRNVTAHLLIVSSVDLLTFAQLNVCRLSTVLQPRQSSCVILFGIPNHVVAFADTLFQHDILPECTFILDPSFGLSPPVDITLEENFAALDNDGKT